MSCEQHYRTLIDKYIDGEATAEERQELNEHLETCDACFEYMLEVRKVVAFVQSASHVQAPEGFTENVMKNLPKRKQTNRFKVWMRRYPLAVAAAVFVLLMSTSLFSMWSSDGEHVTVTGTGNVSIDQESGRVIVPEGEVIQGDLVVRNGELVIEGEVQGNVLLVNSSQYLASPGSVSGEIDEVNQILDWIWYHTKKFFTKVIDISDEKNSPSS